MRPKYWTNTDLWFKVFWYHKVFKRDGSLEFLAQNKEEAIALTKHWLHEHHRWGKGEIQIVKCSNVHR